MTQRTITAKPTFAGTDPQFSQRSDEPENTNSHNNHQLLPTTHPLQQSLPPTPRTIHHHSPQSTQSTQSVQPICQPTTLSQRHHRLTSPPPPLSVAMHRYFQQKRTNGTLPATYRIPPFWQHATRFAHLGAMHLCFGYSGAMHLCPGVLTRYLSVTWMHGRKNTAKWRFSAAAG